jgi:glyoxylase-like metal-dependent hydrolase (beta-lactamase superfamily II)
MRNNFINFWGSFWSNKESDLFFPQETGLVYENLYAIKDRDVNIFVFRDQENIICFDAGYINNQYLFNEFEKIGIRPDQISHLFLTHTDLDHAGSIDRDSQSHWFDNATVYMGKDEKKLIDGRKPRKFLFHNPVEIDRKIHLLQDMEVITIGNSKVQILFTPGHTCGHVSYLINESILCAGDALIIKNGFVKPFYPVWNMDHSAAITSTRRLANLHGIKILCTAHTQCSHFFDEAVKNIRNK